ncbi:MAG: hypothetical protein K2X48_14160 [Chitinophagaceae bacterium]|nr:hypothetical protein [Chitinophagaceae bacterium]
MNRLKKVSLLMQRSTLKGLLLLLLAGFIITSCGSNKGLFKKKNDCGCPSKKGMVGY